jgi:hypothetical protein
MGGVCYRDAPAGDGWERPAPTHPRYRELAQEYGYEGVGQVRILIVALDYKCSIGHPQTNVEACELTCPEDAINFKNYALACGVQNSNITVLLNEDATLTNVKKQLRAIGHSCGPEDFFIFYFSGHGDTVPDEDDDEKDNADEAYVLIADNGSVHCPKSYLVDDEFASILMASVHKETQILIVSDCCHSGTIADLDNSWWKEKGFERVMSISGCRDAEESIDTGHGGVLTGSLLLAASTLHHAKLEHFSVGKMYNIIRKLDRDVFGSEMREQHIQYQCMEDQTPDMMAWPLLLPEDTDWRSPLNAMSRSKAKMEAFAIKHHLSIHGAD